MTKKPRKQQDDQSREDEFVELPEDRLEQIQQNDPSEEEAGEKSGGEDESPRKSAQDQSRSDAEEKGAAEVDSSREDLLADVRRTLAEEEVEEPEGFFARLRHRFRGSSKEEPAEPEPPELEIDLEPRVTAKEDDLQEVLDDLVPEPTSEPKPKPKKKRPAKETEEEKAIQEFFADLEAMADIVPDEETALAPEGQETRVEEARPEEKLKVPKLPAKSDAEDEVDFEAVRQVALEEYDETRVEPAERKKPLREEVRQTVRELKPMERFLLIGFGVLTVGVLLFSGMFLIVNSISIPTPTPTSEPDLSEIVHPTRLTLPGGWEFNLGQGRVVNGEWTPGGAEWLVGTEISRWVALPWSLQLEAVLRTLKADDQLELMMSNFESLTFNVYSIQEMTMEELLATDPIRPALLVVLYNDEEADGTFWVVTALPARDD